MVKRFIIGIVFGLVFGACTHTQPATKLMFADDIDLSKPEVVVCAWSPDGRTLACISPEEFNVRYKAAQDAH